MGGGRGVMEYAVEHAAEYAILGGVVLLVAVTAWFLLRDKGPSDELIKSGLEDVPGFTVTEIHAHNGTGLAADETTGRVLIHGKDRPQIALVHIRDMVAWFYIPRDEEYEMEIQSRRHKDAFFIRFKSRSQADLWIKIFIVMAKDNGGPVPIA